MFASFERLRSDFLGDEHIGPMRMYGSPYYLTIIEVDFPRLSEEGGAHHPEVGERGQKGPLNCRSRCHAKIDEKV
jgi:hypothetical protein